MQLNRVRGVFSQTKFISFVIYLIFILTTCEGPSPVTPKQKVRKEKILFSSGIEGHMNIFMMDTDGTNQIQLTHYSRGEYRGPRVSSDGTKLLYYRFDEHTLVSGIFLKQDIFGCDPEVPLDYGTSCDFTPTGESIIYSKHIWGSDGGHDAIFRFDLIDSTINRITTDSSHNWCPDVSPDGSKIVFSTWRSLNAADTIVFSRWDIMLMNINGTQQEYLLAPERGLWRGGPRFSPNGHEIVYSVNRILRVIRLDNREIDNIVEMPYPNLNKLYPCFDVAGTKIYFDSGSWENSAIYVINKDGSDLQKLTDDNIINRHAHSAIVEVLE